MCWWYAMISFQAAPKPASLAGLFNSAEEIVYTSPTEGGAQVALATVARQLGKRATIFVARRAKPHPRTLQAAKLRAKIVPVAPGYLSVVQARAREYCAKTGARLLPFGADMPGALNVIAAAARATGIETDEVWCAAGSGVLARALAAAWPKARRHAVQVGRALTSRDVAGATIHIHPQSFSCQASINPPFPSDAHYEAKAWEFALARKDVGRVVFWNVAGSAETI
jgi:hypothetical protein